MSLKTSSGFSRSFGTAGLGILDTAIVKATFDDDMPPKEKHIVTMLDDLAHRGQCQFYPSLFGRLKEKSYRVVLKTLIVIHRLCRDSESGTVFRLVQNHARLSFLANFKSTSTNALSGMVRQYSVYLQQKMFVYSTYRFSPERVAPSDAKEWTEKQSLKHSCQVLPQLQEQLLRLTNMNASYPLVPLESTVHQMLFRDGMRLFAVISMLIPLVAQSLEKLDVDMTTILYKSCIRMKEVNKGLLFWFETLVRAKVTKETAPAITDLPQSFVDALQTHIATQQKDTAIKSNLEVGVIYDSVTEEMKSIEDHDFDDFDNDEFVDGGNSNMNTYKNTTHNHNMPIPPSPQAEALDSFLVTPKVGATNGQNRRRSIDETPFSLNSGNNSNNNTPQQPQQHQRSYDNMQKKSTNNTANVFDLFNNNNNNNTNNNNTMNNTNDAFTQDVDDPFLMLSLASTSNNNDTTPIKQQNNTTNATSNNANNSVPNIVYTQEDEHVEALPALYAATSRSRSSIASGHQKRSMYQGASSHHASNNNNNTTTIIATAPTSTNATNTTTTEEDPFSILNSIDYNEVPQNNLQSNTNRNTSHDPFSQLLQQSGMSAKPRPNDLMDPFALPDTKNPYNNQPQVYNDPFMGMAGVQTTSTMYHNPYTLQQPRQATHMHPQQQQPAVASNPGGPQALVEYNSAAAAQNVTYANPYLNVGTTSFLAPAQYDPYHDPYAISALHQPAVDIIAVRSPPNKHQVSNDDPFSMFQ